MKLPQARHEAVKHEAKWKHTCQEAQSKLINVYKKCILQGMTHSELEHTHTLNSVTNWWNIHTQSFNLVHIDFLWDT
jgi:hypothetical protein